MIKIEKIDFCGWDDCMSISDGSMQAIVTAGFGPRIICLRKSNGENFMNLVKDTLGKHIRNDGYALYGGHRCWHAPERADRNYIADNVECDIETDGNSVTVMAQMEKETRTRRGLKISISGGELSVVNILENHSLFDLKMAVWGITQLQGDGKLVFPTFCPGGGLNANRRIALWAYSDAKDRRFSVNSEYLAVTPSDRAHTPFKVGITSSLLRAVYFRKNQALDIRSTIPFDYADEYPDLGCNFECYTGSGCVEAEWLSPLRVLKTGERITLEEKFKIFDNVPAPTEATVMSILQNLK